MLTLHLVGCPVTVEIDGGEVTVADSGEMKITNLQYSHLPCKIPSRIKLLDPRRTC
jgi:hypothetical protein